MVNSALGMAIEHRGAGRLIHTDHRPQFTSWTFSQNVRPSGLVQSIGSVGDAYDNAVVESFWGTMQIELLNRRRWTTRLERSLAVVDWIEGFYNHRRRPSSLGNISPIECERRQRHLTARLSQPDSTVRGTRRLDHSKGPAESRGGPKSTEDRL